MAARAQSDKMRGRAVYFVRICPKAVTDKTVEQDIAAGQISGTPLDSFRALMTDLFVPVLKEQGNWGKSPEESVTEFMQVMPPSQRCAAKVNRSTGAAHRRPGRRCAACGGHAASITCCTELPAAHVVGARTRQFRYPRPGL